MCMDCAGTLGLLALRCLMDLLRGRSTATDHSQTSRLELPSTSLLNVGAACLSYTAPRRMNSGVCGDDLPPYWPPYFAFFFCSKPG